MTKGKEKWGGSEGPLIMKATRIVLFVEAEIASVL